MGPTSMAGSCGRPLRGACGRGLVVAWTTTRNIAGRSVRPGPLIVTRQARELHGVLRWRSASRSCVRRHFRADQRHRPAPTERPPGYLQRAVDLARRQADRYSQWASVDPVTLGQWWGDALGWVVVHSSADESISAPGPRRGGIVPSRSTARAPSSFRAEDPSHRALPVSGSTRRTGCGWCRSSCAGSGWRRRWPSTSSSVGTSARAGRSAAR